MYWTRLGSRISDLENAVLGSLGTTRLWSRSLRSPYCGTPRDDSYTWASAAPRWQTDRSWGRHIAHLDLSSDVTTIQWTDWRYSTAWCPGSEMQRTIWYAAVKSAARSEEFCVDGQTLVYSFMSERRPRATGRKAVSNVNTTHCAHPQSTCITHKTALWNKSSAVAEMAAQCCICHFIWIILK